MIKFSRLIFINAVKLPSHTIKQLFYISFEISCIAIQYADLENEIFYWGSDLSMSAIQSI